MALQVLADVEEMLIMQVLRPSTDVQGRVGTRVYDERPPEPTFPLVTIQRLGGSLAHSLVTAWLDVARVQYDVWSTELTKLSPTGTGTKKGTWRIADTIRNTLLAAVGTYTGGVISAVEESIAPRSLRDPDSLRAHFFGEVIVTVHP